MPQCHVNVTIPTPLQSDGLDYYTACLEGQYKKFSFNWHFLFTFKIVIVKPQNNPLLRMIEKLSPSLYYKYQIPGNVVLS